MAPFFSRSLIISPGKTVSCWVLPFTECVQTRARLQHVGRTAGFSTHPRPRVLHHTTLFSRVRPPVKIFLYRLESKSIVGELGLPGKAAIMENKTLLREKWQWQHSSTFRIIRCKSWPGPERNTYPPPLFFRLRNWYWKMRRELFHLKQLVNGRVGTRTHHDADS